MPNLEIEAIAPATTDATPSSTYWTTSIQYASCYHSRLMRLLTSIMAIVMTTACGSGEKAAAPAAAAAAPVTSAVVSGTVPRNAVVALVPVEAQPSPSGPAVMDQYAKQFVPNVLYVRLGQPVEFRNSEDMPHNVTVIRRGSGTQVFNVSTEPQQKYVHTFDRAGQFDVTCDIHPGMQATLIAAPSPIATVADDGGRFSLSNVKPGAYKLHVTFEGRTVEQNLDVAGARTEITVNK
jgi:plastocyanin